MQEPAPDQPPGGGCDDGDTVRARLLARARELPRCPGVYLLKDAEERVIYVGKASSLPSRVSSYFQQSADHGLRKEPMLEAIRDFDVIECEGEWEALLMEARLIKDLRPRFNARLTDDKTFPYLAVTMRDDFPGVFVTRDPASERFKGARIFGPFTSVASLRHAVQLLQRVFQFRTCELEIREGDPRNRSVRPCLLHSIGQCTAPCADRVSRERYRRDIDRFLRFFESRRSVMLRELRQEMEKASAARRFEEAAVLRDQITAIEKLDDRERRRGEVEYDWQPEVTFVAGDPSAGERSLRRTLGLEQPIRCMEAFDIAHLGGGETVASKVAFVDGRPFKDGYRRFRVRSASNDDYQALREVVGRRYREAGRGEELFPDLILIDGGAGQLRAALDAFEALEQQPPMVIALAKKDELIFVQHESEPIRLGRENPGLKLCQAIRDEAHRFARHYHHVLRRRAVTGVDAPLIGSARRRKRAQSKAAPSGASAAGELAERPPNEGDPPSVPGPPPKHRRTPKPLRTPKRKSIDGSDAPSQGEPS
ncbi:MAG: excinuclease ABC subunit UvrC [Phycisphaeraceae bacterium]|nr:excinuclease ABC subunit UvrC [Phycisphaeraceae bacterium]